MRFLTNDIHINVEISGEGMPLVLLHGFTGASSNWMPFFPSWKKKCRVIAIDLIGHGKTDAPHDLAHYSMDQAARDLTVILDQLGIERAHFLGYSMGGRLALFFSLHYPERVRSLLLESSSPGLRTEEERHERAGEDEKLADRIERIDVKAFAGEWGGLPLFTTQNDSVREKLRKQRVRNCEIGLANSLRGMGTGVQPSLWERLSSVDFPVLLVAGSLDEKFFGIAKQMKERIPHAQIIAVQNTGHAIHAENPRFFDKIVKEWIIKNERTE